MDFPILDLTDPDIIPKLTKACEELGFFIITNHSIPPQLLTSAFDTSEQFFSLPLEEKLKCTKQVAIGKRGYTPMGDEKLDTTTNSQTSGDTKEGYYIWRNDPDNVWPDKDRCDLEGVIGLYLEAVTALAKDLLIPLFEQALQVPIGYFSPWFETPCAVLRLLRYSMEISDPSQGKFACGQHSDYGFCTILATDGTPGIQIKPRRGDNGCGSDKEEVELDWIDVPHVEGGLIVNLGDILQRWTSDRFKSTLHRVIIKDNGSDQVRKERKSMPFFFEPNPMVVVEGLCREGENAPRYPPITYGNYLAEKYKAAYGE